MNRIGKEIVGRNFAKGKAFFEFADVQFYPGSVFVKPPDRSGL
jgi:hypothetical protein